MSKNYNEASEMAEVLFDAGGLPEQMVALGYRAALADAYRALTEAAAAAPHSEGSSRVFAIMKDKLASIARVSEKRAEELKV